MTAWICAVIAAIIVSGILAACDSALLTVSKARVEELVKEGRLGAKKLLSMLDETPRYVNLLVLLRICGEEFAAIGIFYIAWEKLPFAQALFVSLLITTVLSYIFIGVGPRTLGRQHAYAYACLSSGIISFLVKIFHPLTQLLIMVGNALTPGKPLDHGPFASEVELREIVDMAQENGALDADERNMIQAVFDLHDNNMRSVMVPRTEMVWIESNKTVPQALSLAVRSGYSRIPVIGEDLDDIVGVLYVKDLVNEAFKKDMSFSSMAIAVGDLVRPAHFLPDSKLLDDVLTHMQKTRTHIAFAVNEYGSIAGLVTMEDIVEEIVGEITDEYDYEEIAPITDLGNNTYRLSARLSLEDFGQLCNIDCDIEEYEDVDTVLGLVGLHVGRVPLPGITVECHGWKIVTEGGKDRRGRTRVKTVYVTPASNMPDISHR